MFIFSSYYLPHVSYYWFGKAIFPFIWNPLFTAEKLCPFLIRIHISVKETHLKSMKRKTKITSFTQYHFSIVKINRNENLFPMGIDNLKFNSFFPFGSYSRNLHYFSTLSFGCFHLFSKSELRVLKPDKLKGAFQNFREILRFFHIVE